MKEEKEIRFKKVAGSRINRILSDLRLLSNCANKNNYSYTEKDVDKMFKAIDEGVKNLKNAFYNKREKGKRFEF